MFQMPEGTMNIGVVVLLGLGTVFVGLICIIIMCVLMGKIVRLMEKGGAADAVESAPAVVPSPVAPAAAPAAAAIPNRPELVAAIACALAEELGTDVSAIRICSLRKV